MTETNKLIHILEQSLNKLIERHILISNHNKKLNARFLSDKKRIDELEHTHHTLKTDNKELRNKLHEQHTIIIDLQKRLRSVIDDIKLAERMKSNMPVNNTAGAGNTTTFESKPDITDNAADTTSPEMHTTSEHKPDEMESVNNHTVQQDNTVPIDDDNGTLPFA